MSFFCQRGRRPSMETCTQGSYPPVSSAYCVVVVSALRARNSLDFFLLESVLLSDGLENCWLFGGPGAHCFLVGGPRSARISGGPGVCLSLRGRLLPGLFPVLPWRVTWLILPVVICLSQRLSHACLSTILLREKLRKAH